MHLDSSIFRKYDIRGIAGTQFSPGAIAEYEKWYGKFPGINITPQVATAIGKAYGTLILKKGGKNIVIGHEERQFGKELKEYFIKGVRAVGINVTNIGVALSPMVYFAIEYYGFDGGVCVTGSHSVYFFNGFKLMARHVDPIYGSEIQMIKKLIVNDKFELSSPGTLDTKQITHDYEKYLLENIKLYRPLKIVIDSGNGTAGLFAPAIFRKLGCEVIELYSNPDANFPNHTPDPEDPFNMEDLITKVKAEHADLGLGFDADGDRLGVVSETGEFVPADKLILVLARDILQRHPGKKIIYDVKCSYLLDKIIAQYGGIPVMFQTGHAPIKAALRNDRDILFAGELSGHLYLVEDYFKIDDGLFAASKILSILSGSNDPFSRLLSAIPSTFATPEIKLPCPDESKEQIVSNIAKSFTSKFRTVNIEGVRVIFSETSWALVRASNTSPNITLRFEANTEKEVLEIKNIIADELEKYPQITDRLDRTRIASHTGRLGWV